MCSDDWYVCQQKTTAVQDIHKIEYETNDGYLPAQVYQNWTTALVQRSDHSCLPCSDINTI